ncbi:MAG: Flp family type IVb pilin [Phycisphaerales bacterium]|nr:MAG: Flp family type IVb pilin [Phycisphaerales bacterium]
MTRSEPDQLIGSIRRCKAAQFLRDETAATAVETAFILAVILLAAIGAISGLGLKNRDIWANVASAIQKAM